MLRTLLEGITLKGMSENHPNKEKKKSIEGVLKNVHLFMQ